MRAVQAGSNWKQLRKPMAIGLSIAVASIAAIVYRVHRQPEPASGLASIPARFTRASSREHDFSQRLSRGHGDLAVRRLEDASRQSPADARLLNDLAAALLTRAVAQDKPLDYIQALATADAAVAAASDLPEARFNRALALDYLHLRDAAREAWEDYLRIDSRSDWAAEARTRAEADNERGRPDTGWEEKRAQLDQLHGDEKEAIREIIARFPQDAGAFVEEELLGAWADAVVEHRDQEALQLLARARGISDALVAQCGEHMPADALAAASWAHGDPLRRVELAAAHRDYRKARRLYAAHRVAEARPLFERARRGFADTASPLAAAAEFSMAVGEYDEQQYDAALAVVERIARATTSERYPRLLARIYWLIGLIDLGKGDPMASISDYQSALAIAQRTGAVEDIAGLHAVLAEDFGYLGEPTEAWRHLLAALADAPKIHNPRRLEAIVGEAGEACAGANQWTVSRYFRDAAVRIAAASQEPVTLAHTLLARGQAWFHIGDLERAREDLAAARQAFANIKDPIMRRRSETGLLLAESEILTERDPAAGISDLSRALDYYADLPDHFFLSRLLQVRGRLELALGNRDAAEKDFRQGIEEYETQRRRVPNEPLQISFFDRSRSLFDEMIRLQAKDQERREVALDYAERDRARSLLDRLGPLDAAQRAEVLGETLSPLTTKEIQQALPASVAIIEYALLDDRLLVWVLRSDASFLADQPIDPAQLQEQVANLGAAYDDGTGRGSDLANSLAALYDLLVRPVLPFLGSAERVVFIPDKALHAVPFGALWNRSTGRYLIADRIISVAPSSTLWVQAVRRDRQLEAGGYATALAVGNPRFNRRFSSSFADLPHAATEAEALASRLQGSELLTDELATRAAFSRAAGHHPIIHFGGHAVVNEEFPLLSYLLMAPDSESDAGLFYARELYHLRLGRTRLAVLAACATAKGQVRGEGILSLARSFLAAGVPMVIASLWRIDDEPTSRLFQVFYRQLDRGLDPAAALRNAQLALLANPDPLLHSPAAWAAFEIMGASAPKPA